MNIRNLPPIQGCIEEERGGRGKLPNEFQSKIIIGKLTHASIP